MLTQEANEALPSWYCYCRFCCAYNASTGGERSTSFQIFFVSAYNARTGDERCLDLIILAYEANEEPSSRYSYCRCYCAYNACSGGERWTSFQLNILNTKPAHPSVCPSIHRVIAKHYEKTTGFWFTKVGMNLEWHFFLPSLKGFTSPPSNFF